MTDLLLDTDAVSILFKPVHPLYSKAYGITAGNYLTISFMTLAELSLWPVRNHWGAERRELLTNFISLYTPLFPDETTCQHWADIRPRVSQQDGRWGQPIRGLQRVLVSGEWHS